MASEDIGMILYARFRAVLTTTLGLSVEEAATRAEWLRKKVRRLVPPPKDSSTSENPWRYWIWHRKVSNHKERFELVEGKLMMSFFPSMEASGPSERERISFSPLPLKVADELLHAFCKFNKTHAALREMHLNSEVKSTCDSKIDIYFFAYLKDVVVSSPTIRTLPTGETQITKAGLAKLKEYLELSTFIKDCQLFVSGDPQVAKWINESAALAVFIRAHSFYLMVLLALLPAYAVFSDHTTVGIPAIA